MKKVLIVLLSVLLALSFISCEKDKSGEVIQNYEDFIKSSRTGSSLNSIFSPYIREKRDTKTYKIDKEFSDADKDDIKSLLEDKSYYVGKILGLDDITVTSVESVSGKLQGDASDYTASDVVIKFKYTTSNGKDDEEATDKAIDGEIKMNMKYSDSGINGDGIETYSVSSLSLQGVSYKDVSYSEAWKKTGERNYTLVKYTSATVGGNNVELRLLNVYC